MKKNDVLSDVNLTLTSGRIIGLVGANGSGKTMLLRLMAGLIRATKGTVSINNKILGKDIDFWEDEGVLIENPGFLPNLTGKENLELICSIRDIVGAEEIDNQLREVGLDPSDRRTVRRYSLGMRQRLGIAAALVENPSLLLLDEPTNGLDSDGLTLIEQALIRRRDAGALLVVASHDRYALTRISDALITVAEGRLMGIEELGGAQ